MKLSEKQKQQSYLSTLKAVRDRLVRDFDEKNQYAVGKIDGIEWAIHGFCLCFELKEED